MICQYGCGREAFFQIGNGKWCCCKSYNSCPAIKEKNSIAIKKAHQEKPGIWRKENVNYGVCDPEWRKNHPEVGKKSGETLSRRILSGEINWKGRHLSKEHREKISLGSRGGNNGFVKTKYYEIFCEEMKKIVKVQGTWEYKYCNYLNENNIKWIRSKKMNIRYRLNEDDILRSYFPDFYLPDSDEYIEIKGYLSESDRMKMEKVFEYNKDKKIIMLRQVDLELLGIKLR